MKERIKQLTDLINKWNYEYFIENKPTVSDLEYDQALLELEHLELKYPEHKHPNSPTDKVGFGSNMYQSSFSKVKHVQPMLSLAKAYNFDEVIKYYENIEKVVPIEQISFSLEPKIDGLSIALHYKNGYLVQALTRGDGSEGEDVTLNISQIGQIPKIIPYTNDLEVRGEVFMPKKAFAELNDKMSKKGEKLFANPRNAASGTLRQLDQNVVAQRGLQGIFYELVEPAKHNISTQKQALEFIKSLSIPTNDKINIVELEDLEEEIEDFAEVKNKLDFDADGLVIKLNALNYWEKMGKTAKFPKHSIAFKYEVESAQSKIINIITTVGRSGKITYVANIEPVVLNQTTVQNATLHNYNFIQEMNINIGDEVTIVKAGEIIPKVIALATKNTANIYPKTLLCPSCKHDLVEFSDIVDQYCVNDNCEEMIINKIAHFASRKALNIVGLGINTVKDLFKANILTKIEDIFVLKNHFDQIIKLERYGETKVNNLLNSIEKSLKNDFAKVLFALGLKHVGIRASKLISKQYSTFSEMILDKDLIKIKHIDNIGPKIIESIEKFLNNSKNVELIDYFDSVFEYSKNVVATSDKLQGLSFVITGKLSQPREHFADLIEKNGGLVLSSVSKKTNFLLCGEDAGSKKEKAEQLNIQILDEEKFNFLLK